MLHCKEFSRTTGPQIQFTRQWRWLDPKTAQESFLSLLFLQGLVMAAHKPNPNGTANPC
jgi:hypothetical protein